MGVLWTPTAVVDLRTFREGRGRCKEGSLALARFFQHRQSMTGPMGDSDNKRDRGRPATAATPILVQVMPSDVAGLDAYIAAQPDPKPSRPEAIGLALRGWLTGLGHLSAGEGADAPPDASRDGPAPDRYADADPNEGVMVTGVGPMTLRRAVRKLPDWREHHGLGLINVYRGANKRPGLFDEADLGRLAQMEQFR